MVPVAITEQTNKIMMQDSTQNPRSRFQTLRLPEKTSKVASFRSTSYQPNSFIINPEATCSGNTKLPKIPLPKQKRKKCNYLQSWLDEALGEKQVTDAGPKTARDRPEGPMKVLQKFELDKRYLQSLNIPGERIERLYQSLYVYSHGIDKVFKEILEFAGQHGKGDLLGSFWRAFARLLENCTSYQTVFQKMEADHIQHNAKLKYDFELQAHRFAQQREELEDKLLKLQKTIEEKQSVNKRMEEEYKVIESTLGLTDQAFNDEVYLRLKFEEKINTVYTTYQELKLKYQKLVEEMKIKNGDVMEIEKKESQLQAVILKERLKADRLNQLFDGLNQDIVDRDQELEAKKQEIEDLKQTLQAKLNSDYEASDIIEDYLNKQKALNAKTMELETTIEGNQITINSQQQKIQSMMVTLQEQKHKNAQIYEHFAEAGRKAAQMESQLSAQSQKLATQELRISNSLQQIAGLKQELDQVKGTRDSLQTDLIVSHKNLSNSDCAVHNNSRIIEELRAVKDKYERINEHLSGQIGGLETSLNSTTNQLTRVTEEFERVKLLADTKTHQLAQMEKILQQERQASKAKANSLLSILQKKEKVILDIQQTCDQLQTEKQTMKSTIILYESEIAEGQSQRVKLHFMLNAKKKQVKDLEDELQRNEERFRAISVRLEASLKANSTAQSKLSCVQFVLQTKSDEQRIEITNLKQLLEEYKVIIHEKAQYIHPMLYEECQAITLRALSTEREWRKQLQARSEQTKQTTQGLDSMKKHHAQEINGLSKKLETVTRNNADLQQKVTKLRQLLKKNEQQFSLDRTQTEKFMNESRKETKLLVDQIKCLQDDLRVQKAEFIKLSLENQQSKQRVAEIQRQKEDMRKIVETKTRQTQTECLQIIEQVSQHTQRHMCQSIGIQASVNLSRSEESQAQKSNSQEEFKRQVAASKKVEKQDFKRALRLTYMRR